MSFSGESKVLASQLASIDQRMSSLETRFGPSSESKTSLKTYSLSSVPATTSAGNGEVQSLTTTTITTQ